MARGSVCAAVYVFGFIAPDWASGRGENALDVVSIALLPLLQISDFLRELVDDLILQGVPLAQMVGLQELQPGNLNVQVHLLTNIGIARTQGLDLRIRQRLLVNVLGGVNRALARHDLPDELLLVLHRLIKAAVKGVLRHIGADLHLRILVALTDDPTFPLRRIGRSVFAYSSFSEHVKSC